MSDPRPMIKSYIDQSVKHIIPAHEFFRWARELGAAFAKLFKKDKIQPTSAAKGFNELTEPQIEAISQIDASTATMGAKSFDPENKGKALEVKAYMESHLGYIYTSLAKPVAQEQDVVQQGMKLKGS